jgi:iron(III) transport system substrate-binding protein
MRSAFCGVVFPFVLAFALCVTACSRTDVVVYAAADQALAEPILREIGARTNLSIRAVYDIEASKAVGLARTMLEERERPGCDVFWNS